MVIKEKYFSESTIDYKAFEIISNTNSIIGQLKNNTFFPKESALIVIDMQDFFCDEKSHAFIPSVTAIIPKIKMLVDTYKKAGLPVIFTKHINNNDNAGMMKKWWKDIITSSNMNDIIAGLDTKNSCLVTKTQYDAFYNTELEKFLRENNISQLVITGVMTNLCCETTARSAFVKGFETFLPVDSTATYNESFHAATVLNLAHGFSNLILSSELCKKINEANGYESL